MRLYELRAHKPDSKSNFPATKEEPGFTLPELIDEFYQQGVVPDFIPADLGTDEESELDSDGWFAVDPKGNMRFDKFEEYNQQLLDGTYDPETTRLADTVSPEQSADTSPAVSEE